MIMVCKKLHKHPHQNPFPNPISPPLAKPPNMPNLPHEIVTDILCRLPPKSLMQFRTVSKPWCNLIDSRDFMKIHLKQSKETGSNLFLLLGFLGLYSVDMDLLDSAIPLNPPFSSSDISNSCNSLVLVRGGRGQNPFIWNPFTRKYKTLPDAPVDLPIGADSDSLYIRYGFGYDSENDDYKVLRCVEFRGLDMDWISTEAMLYSLRSNSWRKIADSPYQLPRSRSWGVHVNGALHTIMPLNNSEMEILALDLHSERSYLVPMPKCVVSNNFGLSLNAMDGCLCLISPRKRDGSDIWIMKDYGVKESWTKLLSIAPPLLEPQSIVSPVAYSKSRDEVLLNLNDEKIVWYDLSKKTVRNVKVSGLPFRFYAEVCVASLVPVDFCNGGKLIKKLSQPDRKVMKVRGKRDTFLSEGFKLVL